MVRSWREAKRHEEWHYAEGRALGPIMGGLLYWKFDSSMPYWIGAAFLVVPFFMALGLPPVPDHDEVNAGQ